MVPITADNEHVSAVFFYTYYPTIYYTFRKITQFRLRVKTASLVFYMT